MVARVYAQLVAHEFGMLLKCHCLVGIVCHDILKHVLLCQDVSVLAVALQPESGRLMVKVICYCEIVHSDSLDILIYLLFVSQVVLLHVFALSKNIIGLWRGLVLLLLHLGHHFFHVLDFFVFLFPWLWLSPDLRDHLCVHFNHFLVLIGFWVDCLGPSIVEINLLNALSGIFDV